MAVRDQPQTMLGEQTIDDPDLEATLESRERAKQAAGKARKRLKELDDDAKTRIRELDLGQTPARIGRFVVATREVEGRAVSFETEPTTRVTIRLVPGDISF